MAKYLEHLWQVLWRSRGRHSRAQRTLPEPQYGQVNAISTTLAGFLLSSSLRWLLGAAVEFSACCTGTTSEVYQYTFCTVQHRGCTGTSPVSAQIALGLHSVPVQLLVYRYTRIVPRARDLLVVRPVRFGYLTLAYESLIELDRDTLHTRLGSSHECHSGDGRCAFALVSFVQVGLALHGPLSVEVAV
uniref:Uncharacterized protein n=1 Tax=Ananas comosus var. bracteatus TaxID=296719 RepID=A0A6V7PSI7_ANACO|nr:unnamed protein product [Ananas comosus var. bracteatus]